MKKIKLQNSIEEARDAYRKVVEPLHKQFFREK